MGKHDEGYAARRTASPSPGAESRPSGMPAGSSAQASVYAQAAEAAKGIQAGMQQASTSSHSWESRGPTQAPTRNEANPGTPDQRMLQAGQAMLNAGVATNATQSPETKAKMQTDLASGNKSEHNGSQQGSRCAAAQQQAASAPAPSPSQSMEK